MILDHMWTLFLGGDVYARATYMRVYTVDQKYVCSTRNDDLLQDAVTWIDSQESDSENCTVYQDTYCLRTCVTTSCTA